MHGSINALSLSGRVTMMMHAIEYMVRAFAMDAKASTSTDTAATELYQELADQWRRLYDQAIWQDWAYN